MFPYTRSPRGGLRNSVGHFTVNKPGYPVISYIHGGPNIPSREKVKSYTFKSLQYAWVTKS